MSRGTMDDASAGVSHGKRRTPEERELDQKSSELAQLESALIQREIELVTTEREIAIFERKYTRSIGVRYAQLDELDSQIAEVLARRRKAAKAEKVHEASAKARPAPAPDTPRRTAPPPPEAPWEDLRADPPYTPNRDTGQAPPEPEFAHEMPASSASASFARERARATAEECASVRELGAGDDVMETTAKTAATPALKAIYREVAKQVHPDLTADPVQRARRVRLMADANLAYRQGDEQALHFILEQWESDPELVAGEGVAIDLVRTIRKVAQVSARLERIEAEIHTLLESDLWTLQERLDVPGRHTNLMEELGMRLDIQIAEASKRLASLMRREKKA